MKKIALTSLGIVGLGILSGCNNHAIEKKLKAYANCSYYDNIGFSVCGLHVVMQTIEKNTYGQSKVINTENVGVPSGASFAWIITPAVGTFDFSDAIVAAGVNVKCKEYFCTPNDNPTAIFIYPFSVVTVRAKGSVTYEGNTYKLQDMDPIVLTTP